MVKLYTYGLCSIRISDTNTNVCVIRKLNLIVLERVHARGYLWLTNVAHFVIATAAVGGVVIIPAHQAVGVALENIVECLRARHICGERGTTDYSTLCSNHCITATHVCGGLHRRKTTPLSLF